MKFFLVLCLSAAVSVWAQVPPETVVATIDGKKFTAEDLDRIVAGLPPQLQTNFNRDRKEFLRQLALLMRLSGMADKAKLSEQSPYKERLSFARMQVLWQAQLDEASKEVVVMPDDQKKFYEANRDRFSQMKIKVIYIAFSSAPPPQAPPGGKKVFTDAEAKAKADDLVKQIRAGADFVKLVKEHSQDATSAAKDGDFGTVRKSDSLPEPVKAAIFALKQGEISDPVRQANGYYIFRAEEIRAQPYDEVKDEIFKELKQQRFQQWFEGMRKSVDVKFDNEAYFAPKAPQPAPAK